MATVDKSHQTAEATRAHAQRVKLQNALARFRQRLIAMERLTTQNNKELVEIKEILWEFRVHTANLHIRIDELFALIAKGRDSNDRD